VLRVGGKGAAAVVLAGDVLKGFIPVAVAAAFGLSGAALALVGLAAFLGHIYPLFFGFRGGKGVATYLGVLFALAWPVGLATAATWLGMAALFRYSSLAALAASVLSPVYMAEIAAVPPWTVATAAMSAVLLWRHRENIRRLASGNETKIGTKG
jgi:glycerol-3-phosphate acyltransferase PlsY